MMKWIIAVHYRWIIPKFRWCLRQIELNQYNQVRANGTDQLKPQIAIYSGLQQYQIAFTHRIRKAQIQFEKTEGTEIDSLVQQLNGKCFHLKFTVARNLYIFELNAIRVTMWAPSFYIEHYHIPSHSDANSMRFVWLRFWLSSKRNTAQIFPFQINRSIHSNWTIGLFHPLSKYSSTKF